MNDYALRFSNNDFIKEENTTPSWNLLTEHEKRKRKKKIQQQLIDATVTGSTLALIFFNIASTCFLVIFASKDAWKYIEIILKY